MNDNNKPPIDNTSTDYESVSGSGRVFDITSDLNISPVEDSDDNSPVALPAWDPKGAPAQTPAQTPVPSIPVPPQPSSESTLISSPVSEPEKEETMPTFVTAPTSTPVPPPVSEPKPTPAPVSVKNPTPISNSSSNFNTPITQDKNPMDVLRQQNPNLKPLRTYESDIAEAMSHKRMSTASIVIAEKNRQEEQKRQQEQQEVAPQNAPQSSSGVPVPQPVHERSYIEKSPGVNGKLIMVILSLILVVGGAGGAYYLYSQSAIGQPPPPPPARNLAPSIIPADSQTGIEVRIKTNMNFLSLMKSQLQKSQTPNTIVELIPFEKKEEGNVRLSSTQMLEVMDLDAPDMLKRSLTSEWMMGTYADEQGKRDLFVIVTTNFFQNTFAGMLSWEKLMPDDLKHILVSDGAGISTNPLLIAVSTTTATSTASTTASKTATTTATSTKTAISTTTLASSTQAQTLKTPLVLRGQFKDKIIKNRDVRAFILENNSTLFLYSFIDTEHLVIAKSEKALTEILVRLEKQAFVR